MDYGKALRKLRTDNGMTQQALAERVNVTAQAISKWENGVNQPDIAMLQDLCAVFGVSVDEFLALAKEDGEEAVPAEKEQAVAEPSEKAPAPKAKECAEQEQAAPAPSAATAAAVKKRSGDYPWYYIAGALALAILALILAAVFTFGSNRKLSAQQIYEKVNPSVFYIEVDTEYGKQGGSGFFIDKKGTAVTNYHVIKGGHSARIITADGRRYDVEQVLGASQGRDLAVLQIDIPFSRAVSMAYSVRTGETVYTIGYPESFVLGTEDSTFTNGIVSKSSYYLDGYDYIQTNADITHGNSGGVLLNSKGQVIGITTGQLNVGGASYMNLAIPASAVKNVRRDVNMTLEEFLSYEFPPATPEYTVTFYNGNEQLDLRRVEEGALVSPPKTSCEGYTFEGWFQNKELTTPFDFSAPIMANTSVYGKFTPITYYISYRANGGDGTMERRTVKYGESYQIEQCAFVYKRWQFSHWTATVGGVSKQYTPGESVKNLTATDGEEIAFTAAWEEWKYTILYDAAGGSCKASDTVAASKSVTLPTPTRYGYTFKHWKYGEQTFRGGQSVKELDPTFTIPQITLTAVWTPITFTVRYHSNDHWGGADDETVMHTVTFGDPAPNGGEFFSKTGYTFHEWEYYVASSSLNTVAVGAANKATGTQGATIDFYSRWKPIQYFVEYDYDGDGNPDSTREVDYGDRFWVWDSYAGTRKGMTIDHWVLRTSDGQESEHKDGTTLTSVESVAGARCRLTAIWRPLRYRIIYFNPDGGNFEEYVSWGEKYTIRGADAFTRAGYTVTGWSHSASGSEVTYSIGQEVENLVDYEGGSFWLYGVWRAHTYTVRFAAPDADSGEMEEQAFTYDEAQPLSLNAFVRAGYYHVGWQLGEEIFHDGERVKNLTAEDNGIVTLTAVWEAALEGEGTAERPYLVADFIGLNKMAFYINYVAGGASSHYALTADIDAENAEFASIGNADSGSSAVVFSGTLDGRGHVIKNITFTAKASFSTGYCFAGLFARIEGGAVKNLGIVDYSIDVVEPNSMSYYQSSYYVGALAGQATESVVEQVFANGTISVKGGSKTVSVGGLVGQFTGTMVNSYASGTMAVSAEGGSTGGVVTTNNLYVGGIAGYAAASGDTVFEYCYANVEITAALTGSSTRINDYLGGFIGFAQESGSVRFNYCFAMGGLIYSRDSATGIGRFLGKAASAAFLSVYANAESQLRPNRDNPSGIRDAYTDNFTNFDWVKEHLKFSDEIWTAQAGGLPTLKMFEEGRA